MRTSPKPNQQQPRPNSRAPFFPISNGSAAPATMLDRLAAWSPGHRPTHSPASQRHAEGLAKKVPLIPIIVARLQAAAPPQHEAPL